MRSKSMILAISILLLMTLFSGCIGDGDPELKEWEGDIKDLLITVDDLGEDYEVYTDYSSDPEIIDDDPTELEELGFKEGAMSDFSFWGFENMVIGSQRVMRFDIDKLDEVMDKFSSESELEEDETTIVEEVDLGSYGDQTIAFKVIEQGSEGFGTYVIGFSKNDISVFIMVISVEDDGDLIKDLAEKVEGKF